MAYSEQSSVANVVDVIDRIATFAGGNGWTVERNTLVAGVRTATLRKGGVSDYVHIYNQVGSSIVRMRVSVGYDAAQPPNLQPNVSGECVTVLEAGPYPKLFLFASGNQVWASVSIARNAEYRHLTFGVIDKAGEFVGGTYVDGSDWGRNQAYGSFSRCRAPFLNNYSTQYLTLNGRMRLDVPDDARENFMFTFGEMTSLIVQPPNPVHLVTDLGIDLGGLASAMALRSDRNAFSGRSILHPITVYASRVGPSVFYSPVGTVHDVRVCSLAKLEPEQEITIGSDVYKVFPMAAKRPMFNTIGDLPAASGNYGYAVRKTT